MSINTDPSSFPCGNSFPALDEHGWQSICEAADADAGNRCGLSYEHYVEIFSAAIDAQVDRLPEHQRAQALGIAARKWSYATPAERQEARDWNAENGCCSHGITLGCCPAGCDR